MAGRLKPILRLTTSMKNSSKICSEVFGQRLSEHENVAPSLCSSLFLSARQDGIADRRIALFIPAYRAMWGADFGGGSWRKGTSEVA